MWQTQKRESLPVNNTFQVETMKNNLFIKLMIIACDPFFWKGP